MERGGQLDCTTQGVACKDAVLELGSFVILRRRDSLSDMVDWHDGWAWASVRHRSEPGLVSS